MNRSRLVLLVAAAVGLAAFLKRPIRRPAARGNWEPAERQRSSR